MPATTRTRDPSKQWLVLEPNRIEKQTFIGVAWALIRPFLTMVVFTMIYSFGEGFAYGGWPSCPQRGMRPTPFWFLRRCCPGSSSARR